MAFIFYTIIPGLYYRGQVSKSWLFFFSQLSQAYSQGAREQARAFYFTYYLSQAYSLQAREQPMAFLLYTTIPGLLAKGKGTSHGFSTLHIYPRPIL